MASDIFSSFDPSSYSPPCIHLPTFITLIPTFLTLLLIPPSFWSTPLLPLQLSSTLMNFMWKQLTQTSAPSLKGTTSFLVTMFLFLMSLNLLGLAPYTFSLTSHLMTTLSFGLPLWLSLILSSATQNLYSFLAALLPGGAPSWLNPFLNLVEMTSINLRPMTLSFRLAANMTAGHVVMGLMSMYLTFKALASSLLATILSFITQLMYICFEVMICLIQSFIFCLLLSLYSNEHSLHTTTYGPPTTSS